MQTKEYVVSLKKDVDYDAFWAEMENPTSGLTFVPDRRIDIVNERVGSLRSCHYALTDEEANILRNDPRVYSVEIPPGHRKDIKLVGSLTQEGNFDKVVSPEGPYQNWGLKRCISAINNFGVGTTAPGNNYDYVLDGTNVDVVIIDSGLMAEHPEFTDKNGDSRVKLIDWYVAADMVNIGPVNLRTTVNASICTNSYINFEKNINTFWDYSFSTLGGSLVVGAISHVMETRPDPASNAIYGGTEDSGKSYRIRFEGRTSNLLDPSVTDLIWECRFVDDNIIELLVLRHDNPLIADWRINLSENGTPPNPSNSIELDMFKTEGLVNGSVAKSVVLTSSDAGLTWNVYGDENTDYHLVKVNNTWNIVEGLATERGIASLTTLDYASPADNAIFVFNTPFNFYCGIAPLNKRSIGDDSNGHGTHVAGIVAGKTFGWAKGANIYTLKLGGLEGSLDQGSGLPIGDAFDLVKEWHRNKPVNPAIGVPNPTVVNMSFGYVSYYVDIEGGSYRGTPWVGTAPDPSKGMIPFYDGAHPVRVNSVDVDIQEMIDEGIVVVIASGNEGHKVDVPLGSDYNNYYTKTGVGNVYYHRGSSPYEERALIVGATGTVALQRFDQKAAYSNHGPGVDIYAPGTAIVSATSWFNDLPAELVAEYSPTPGSSVYKQALLSGTSMAAPQVAGVAALLLQLNPAVPPIQLKTIILLNSTDTIYQGAANDPYTDFRSLHGGPSRHLFHKFGVSKSFRLRFGD